MKTLNLPCGLLFATFASCATTTIVPESDDSRPSIELYYHLAGEEWTLLEGDKRVPVSPNEAIYLCAIGEDPEGVKRVTLNASSGVIGCTSTAPSTVNFSLVAEASEMIGIGDRANTERRVTTTIPMYEICDGAPWTGEILVSADALNFFGRFTPSPVLKVVSE